MELRFTHHRHSEEPHARCYAKFAGGRSAVDLEFLSDPRRTPYELQIRKPHQYHKLAGAPYDSEVRMRVCCKVMRTSESEHQMRGAYQNGSLRGFTSGTRKPRRGTQVLVGIRGWPPILVARTANSAP